MSVRSLLSDLLYGLRRSFDVLGYHLGLTAGEVAVWAWILWVLVVMTVATAQGWLTP